MEKTGYIEIVVKGKSGNIPLTPDNFDIRDIINLLENTEHLIFPGGKKDRPIISYKIEEGSVRNIFKTALQHVIGFNAVLGQINQSQSVDFLDYPTAQVFEDFQNAAIKKDYTFSIKTSIQDTNTVQVDRTTNFYRSEIVWADAEFYFYGVITNMGGKDKSTIHIFTEETGTIIIQTPKEYLTQLEENLLYKNFGIRATGKQHLDTGEIDTSSLVFKDLIGYFPKYDEHYLRSLRKKAKESWLDKIDPEKWLRGIRGGYES